MASRIDIELVVVTSLDQNCRIVSVAGSSDAVVVDPGGNAERILSRLQARGLTCREIWLTHSHLDHCGAVAPLKRATGALLRAHPRERELRAHVADIAAMHKLPPEEMENCPEPEAPLLGGEKLSVSGHEFEVLFTPGHSPGHVVFYHRAEGILLGGDTVFAGSIGRSDLPGGNHRQLMESIRTKIMTLPDSTRILPGHGPDTTVGQERENPFLKE